MKNFVLLFTIVGCASPTTNSDGRIAVTENNALGVASLEVVRSDGTFELRALDRDDNEVASVVRRAGTEPGITAEIDLTVRDATVHVSSYTPEMFFPVQTDPGFHALLAITPVVTELARAKVFALVKRPSAGETSFYTWGCSAGSLQAAAASAAQCCQAAGVTYYWDGYEYVEYQIEEEFHVPTGGVNQNHLIARQYNANNNGAGCKTSDGFTACNGNPVGVSGGNCYYGPAGWAVSANYAPGASAYVVTQAWDDIFSDYLCSYATSGTPTFPTVNGTITGNACGTSGTAAYYQNAASY